MTWCIIFALCVTRSNMIKIIKSILFFVLLTVNAIAYAVTLDEKIGQMLIIGFNGTQINSNSDITNTIKKYNIGGVILFDYNYNTKTFDKNIKNPSQVKTLNHTLQQVTHQTNKDAQREDLPLIISVDFEGGQVNRLSEQHGFTRTYSPKAVAQMPLNKAKDVINEMAETLSENGFNLDFAPDVDVDINPNNPIIGKKERSFSSNPYVVAEYAQYYSDAFLNNKVQCAYKHFPGHGSSSADSHLGFVDVTNSWSTKELAPYFKLLSQQKHCGMVMSAHIVNRMLDPSGMPATLSHTVLTKILRNQLHFEGVIITDDMQMKAISEHYGLEQALVLAINAGADMFIFGNQLVETPQDTGELVSIIHEKVNSGEIPRSRIDEAYERIKAFKQGL
jgi:beta-N-acetylhexosaminidase